MDFNLVGRKAEIQILEKICKSKKAEFCALYGRRRVGKTYLVKQFISTKTNFINFQITGIKNTSLEQHLSQFAKELAKTFFKKIKIDIPKSWIEAFEILTELIEQSKLPTILFFDELPWLASKKSGFLQALDYYWNKEWSTNAGIKLIVCGSAASWMINNLIHAKGGLYNRVTKIIKLNPFSLCETKEFLKSNNIKFNHQQIIKLYMAIGGIPFYLNEIRNDLSVSQNIHELCFSKNGLLYGEFEKLFSSLFDSADIHKEIVEIIAQKREGVTKEEIVKKSSSSMGGRLTKRLNELEASGFIDSKIPFGRKKRDTYYQLNDEYSLFYLKWILPIKNKIVDKNYWQNISKSGEFYNWAGYVFEKICFKHIDIIANKLKIPAGYIAQSWKYLAKTKNENGAQIDLVFERPDETINLCEVKYTETPFIIDKVYAQNLVNKEQTYIKITKTNKKILWGFISANGLKKTMYEENLISGLVTADDLMSEL